MTFRAVSGLCSNLRIVTISFFLERSNKIRCLGHSKKDGSSKALPETRSRVGWEEAFEQRSVGLWLRDLTVLVREFPNAIGMVCLSSFPPRDE